MFIPLFIGNKITMSMALVGEAIYNVSKVKYQSKC